MWRFAMVVILALGFVPSRDAAKPEVRAPAGVVPHHAPFAVADLVGSKAWPYSRVQLNRVEEVLSVELRLIPEPARQAWVVLVRGDATFSPPPGGVVSIWNFACVYLDGETLELLQVELVASPEPGQTLGFDTCTMR